MSYQAVTRPRFYVNIFEWLHLNGISQPWGGTTGHELMHKMIFTLPVDSVQVTSPGSTAGFNHSLLFQSKNFLTSQSFVALLGHNLAETSCRWQVGAATTENDTNPNAVNVGDIYYNVLVHGENQAKAPKNGYSIATYDLSPASAGWSYIDPVTGDAVLTETSGGAVDIEFMTSVNADGTVENPAISYVGTCMIGNYWNAPHSPDLNLKLSYETNTKTIETRGGSSLSNKMGQPPTWYGDVAAWELWGTSGYAVSGPLSHPVKQLRRVWDLSFSFLDKENLLPKYYAVNTDQFTDTIDILDQKDQTLMGSDDFFTRVWNIVGTNLPFIFQPDLDAQEFAICKFAKDISFQQTAPGLYSVQCKLREVW
ncbi:hypothetical protein CMI37_05360 [Candidatus Pacearchaeota archaeon]|nr:hypothetical protein [Candidatus Pacearchaeota archaeon]|tara:strand:- start:111 stop:1211 length:1101 start_codon:yes stop_codon:yes gene_type:complete